MRKLNKFVALFVCLAVLGVVASGLFAAPRRSTYAEARSFLMKHVYSVVAWLPFYDVFNYSHSQDPSSQIQAVQAARASKVKPTGDIKIVRPGDGD